MPSAAAPGTTSPIPLSAPRNHHTYSSFAFTLPRRPRRRLARTTWWWVGLALISVGVVVMLAVAISGAMVIGERGEGEEEGAEIGKD